MAHSTTDSCCLTLPLLTEKWQEDRLEKRLEIARQLYNTLLRDMLKKLRAYQSRTEGMPFAEAKQFRKEYGLNEYAFKGRMKAFYKHFTDNIGSSVAIHGIAAQVWTAFDKVLNGNGKVPHFKRKGEMSSIRGAPYTAKEKDGTRKSGGLEIRYRDGVVEWNGLLLRVKLDPNNAYETEMLSHRIKYCRILRKMGKHKNRYYVQLTLECKPAVKKNPETGEDRYPVGCGCVGLDLGPQTLAYASSTESGLVLLASRVESIEREKTRIQRKMDRSRRATNPENYAPDGAILRGKKLTRNKSHRYLILQHRLAYLQAHQAELRKIDHNQLANHLLSLGDRFIIEDNPVAGWAKRAKNTETSEKTGRYKRKKRFGKSIANRAPAMLRDILNRKLTSRGYPGVEIVPTTLSASRYNHMTQTYSPKELRQRWNVMPDGQRLQRDLYSAFLLQHVIRPAPDTPYTYDNQALQEDYPRFCIQHEQALARLQASGKFVSSMGLQREPAAPMTPR